MIYLLSLWVYAYLNPTQALLHGNLASVGQIPSLVAIYNSSSFVCAGALISSRAVLTAANCVCNTTNRSPYPNITLHVGSVNRTEGVVHRVNQTIIHEHFNQDNRNKNNVALLILKEKVVISDKATPIELPKSDQHFTNHTEVTVVGWGKTHGFPKDFMGHPDDFPQMLLYAHVVIFYHSHCYLTDDQTQFCASGDRNAIKYHQLNYYSVTCQVSLSCGKGDSGDPVILGNTTVGIVSYGYSLGCSQPIAMVFTRVSAFVDWINVKLNDTNSH